MNRVASMALALTLLPFATHAQVSRDERDLSKRGGMSVEELGREPITFELDIAYAATGNPRQRLDLYLPKSRKREKLPVIVFFHGGGWLHGDKSDGAGPLMLLLRTGHYAGVSAGYRLSGEATWPAQIHDSKAAIRWVRANASRYGLDAERIGVWGRSAGGHLALMLGASGDVPELEGDVGEHVGVSSKVAAVANFFGVAELLAMIGPPSDIDRTRADAPEALLLGGPICENSEKARAASPLTYVSPNDPPVLTVHGTLDRTVPYDQAVRLDAALREAGVPSYFVRVEGAGHGDFGTAADDRVTAFFARHLLGERVPVSAAPIPARAEAAPEPSAGEVRRVDELIGSQLARSRGRAPSEPGSEYREAREYRIGRAADGEHELLWIRVTLETGNSYSFYLAALDRASMETLGLRKIGGKGFRSVRLGEAANGYVEVLATYYSPRDAMCCPTIHGRSIFSLVDGELDEGSLEISCPGSAAAAGAPGCE